MAAAVKTFLALCALLAGVSADDQCTTKTYGDTSGRPVHLSDVPLPPPSRTWDLQIDANTACYPARAAGVEVKVCDPEGPPPPTVDILSLYEAIITRNTYGTYTSAQAYVTVFCQPREVERFGRVGGVERVGRAGEVEGVGVVGGVGGVRGVGGVGGVGGVREVSGRGRGVPTAVPLL